MVSQALQSKAEVDGIAMLILPVQPSAMSISIDV